MNTNAGTRTLPIPRPNAAALRRTAALAFAFLVAGCTPAQLRPAPGADDAAWLDQAAIDEVDGVEVVAQADAWTGDPDVLRHVTPMRLVIENEHDAPIVVRYEDVALIAADGTRYNALPPFQVDGSVSDRVVVTPAWVEDPVLESDRFMVAPYFHSAYPALDPYGGRFLHDVAYYDHYHEYWIDRSLPTATMLARALPEGVLEPDGDVAGFFYFPRVDSDHAKVRLRVDVAEAEQGEALGEISIPFVVN